LLLCSVKKLKQEGLLDQFCLHLAKWSIDKISLFYILNEQFHAISIDFHFEAISY